MGLHFCYQTILNGFFILFRTSNICKFKRINNTWIYIELFSGTFKSGAKKISAFAFITKILEYKSSPYLFTNFLSLKKVNSDFRKYWTFGPHFGHPWLNTYDCLFQILKKLNNKIICIFFSPGSILAYGDIRKHLW